MRAVFLSFSSNMGRFPELTPVRSQTIEPWFATLEAGDIRGVLSESEPAVSRVGSLLVFVFVCEELDMFVFVSFGILYPISLVLSVTVPVCEF